MLAAGLIAGFRRNASRREASALYCQCTFFGSVALWPKPQLAGAGWRRSYPRRPGSARFCLCCLSRAADWLRAHFNASKQSLNRSIGSIVPSGHSASTCHRSPSRNTTQKIGSGVAMKLTIFRNLQTAGSAIHAQHFCFRAIRTPSTGIGFARLGPKAASGIRDTPRCPLRLQHPRRHVSIAIVH